MSDGLKWMVFSSIGLLLLPGCSEQVSPQGEAVRIARPLEASALWDEVERAGNFSFQSPQRKSGRWARAYRRHALLRIVEKFPGRIDEARARLELAWLGDDAWLRSNRARHQVVVAQQILQRLINETPDTEGLVEAAYKATLNSQGRPDGTTVYYRRAQEFLASRWSAGGSDAAKAAYLWGKVRVCGNQHEVVRRQRELQAGLFRVVARQYPDDYWGIYAGLRAAGVDANRHNNSPPFDAYMKLAVERPGHPLAGQSLARAAGGYAGGNYALARKETVTTRLERAMELYVRLVREYPDGIELDRSCQTSYRYDPHRYGAWDDSRSGVGSVPNLRLHQGQRCLNVARTEELCLQYFAERPFANFGRAFRTLAEAKGIHDDQDAYREYRTDCWNKVEELASPEKRQQVLAARVHFHLGSWKDAAHVEEALRHVDRLLDEYPDGPDVPAVLDTLALRHTQCKLPRSREEYWRELLDRFGQHPLARIVAFELMFAEVDRADHETSLIRLKAIRKRFPDDVVVGVVAWFLEGKNLEFQHRYDEALAAYDEALLGWPALAPYGEIRFQERRVGLDELNDPEAIKRRIADRIEPEDYRDVRFRIQRDPQTAEEKVQVYREVLERFPDSPNHLRNLRYLGESLAQAKRYDQSREALRECIRQSSDQPRTTLSAQLWLLKLDYLHPVRDGKPMGKEKAIGRMHEILLEHQRAMQGVMPHDPIAQEIQEFYRRWLSSCIAWQLNQQRQPGQPDKWFVLMTSTPSNHWYDPPTVELFDGSMYPVVLLPTFKNALNLAGGPRSHLERPLGLRNDDESQFVDEVVREVFLLDDSGNVLALDTPRMYGPLVTFYDESRTRARVDSMPEDDVVPPPAFLEKKNGKWVRNTGDGWFVWSQG